MDGGRQRSVNEPIVYLSTWRIKDGKFAEYRRFYAQLINAIRESDRDVIAFFAFGNPGWNRDHERACVPGRAHPGATHGCHPRKNGPPAGRVDVSARVMEPLGVQVYGAPGGQAAAMDQGMKDDGVPFTGKERYLGGFCLADLHT